MHAERFGKALGFGVRQAGRTLARAADAATTPSPGQAGAAPAHSPQAPARNTSVPPQAKRRGSLRQGTRQFTSSVIGPAKRAGSVLWLEVTGFFFGVFAALAAFGVWSGRAHLRPGPGQAHELAGVVMLLVFAWFSVSNLVRASRRSRQP